MEKTEKSAIKEKVQDEFSKLSLKFKKNFPNIKDLESSSSVRAPVLQTLYSMSEDAANASKWNDEELDNFLKRVDAFYAGASSIIVSDRVETAEKSYNCKQAENTNLPCTSQCWYVSECAAEHCSGGCKPFTKGWWSICCHNARANYLICIADCFINIEISFKKKSKSF